MNRAWLAIMFMGLGACAEEPPDDGVFADPIACDLNSDCEEGRSCSPFGECVSCLLDIECGPGQICTAHGDCIAECREDRDCNAAGLQCAGGACVDALGNRGCTSNQQCENGLVCGPISGRCIPCLIDAQCGTGRRCQAGACRAVLDIGPSGPGETPDPNCQQLAELTCACYGPESARCLDVGSLTPVACAAALTTFRCVP